MPTATDFIEAIESGSKHLVIKRFTLRYPEQKLKLVGDGYQFETTLLHV
jgi:NADH-quinone oxidoreductase subunit I